MWQPKFETKSGYTITTENFGGRRGSVDITVTNADGDVVASVTTSQAHAATLLVCTTVLYA